MTDQPKHQPDNDRTPDHDLVLSEGEEIITAEAAREREDKTWPPRTMETKTPSPDGRK